MSKFDRSVFLILKPISYFLAFIWFGFLSRKYWSSLDHDLMASIWGKAISILAGNLNSGRSYLITAVWLSLIYWPLKVSNTHPNRTLPCSLSVDFEFSMTLAKYCKFSTLLSLEDQIQQCFHWKEEKRCIRFYKCSDRISNIWHSARCQMSRQTEATVFREIMSAHHEPYIDNINVGQGKSNLNCPF